MTDQPPDQTAARPDRIGPVLHMRSADAGGLRVAAVVALRGSEPPPDLVTEAGSVSPVHLSDLQSHSAWRYDFDLPVAAPWYELWGTRYEVAADLTGPLNVAFVSCNGQEEGDLARDEGERNRAWTDLAECHRETPFNLLLQGGDQLYTDEVKYAHPRSSGWPDEVPQIDAEEAEEVRVALRTAFIDRYLALLAQDAFAWILARVPSLAMWDDHDICDGWGSWPPEMLDGGIGRAIFAAAREMFLLFQRGAAPGDLEGLSLDPEGHSLGFRCDLPDVTILAPDLRSERRPDRVMDTAGWDTLEATVADIDAPRVLLISTVPLLGPRLSIVERIMNATPWLEAYEDDLRDQWQSYVHRDEWRRMLRLVADLHEAGKTVTVLSGEIHMATRAEMATKAGPVHQLVSSGVTHPPPPDGFARVLGALAWLGEAPLDGYPIRIHPLPGKRHRYTTARNALTLARTDGDWTARWRIVGEGPTSVMAI